MFKSYIEFENEMELMQFIASHFENTPVTVSHFSRDGRSQRVAIYTNDYYKNLLKMRSNSNK